MMLTNARRAMGRAARGIPSAAVALLDDDFSSYADRTALVTVGGANPWSQMNQADAATGNLIYLETSPPAGSTGGRAMEYRFYGTPGVCVQDQGGGARLLWGAGTGPRTLWSESRFWFETGFVTTNTETGCGAASPQYKLLFHEIEGGTRSNLYVGLAGTGGLQAGNELTGGASGEVLSNPGDAFSYFIGAWRTVRWMTRLSSTPSAADGAMTLWVDGTKVLEFTSTATTGTRHSRVVIGANTNRSPVAEQSIWWDRIRIFDTDPGWV